MRFASPHRPGSVKSSINPVVTLPKPGKHHEHQLQGALPSDKTQPASLASAVVRFASPHSPPKPSRAAGCFAPVTKPGEHHQHQSSMKSSINPVVTLPKPGRHHEHQLQCFASVTKPGEHHLHQLWCAFASLHRPRSVKSSIDAVVSHAAQARRASLASAAGCFPSPSSAESGISLHEHRPQGASRL